MKIIIAGSRTFWNYDLLKNKCDFFLQNISEVEIVSGAQVSINYDTGEKFGADFFGEQYAHEKGFKISRFPADWSIGKKAGFIRNSEMADYSEALIAFWDGKSKGTKMMIDIAKEKKLKIKVIYFKIT